MTEDQIQTFYTVAQFLNYSKAAKQLNVTQPTVTARIQSLETELNNKLFHKVGKTLALTDAGKTLHPYAKQVLGYLHEAKQAILQLKPPRLQIGFATGFAAPIILETLRIFQERHSTPVLIEEGGYSEAVCEQVRSGELDLGFVKNPIDLPGIQTDVAWDDKLAIHVSPIHPLAKLDRIRPSDLDRQTFICLRRFTPFWMEIDAALESVNDLQRIEVTSLDLVLAMVREGLGFAALSTIAIPPNEIGESFCTIDFEPFQEIPNSVAAVYRSDNEKIDPISNFESAFIHAIQGMTHRN